MQTPSTPYRAPTAPRDRTPFDWRALGYRWFVEYNPLYLVSAMLVLSGCFLLSYGMSNADGLSGLLGGGVVAEAYAGSLVLGAALLTRIGLRRPAVMLGLLAVLYQWDLTLHVETCAYLGAPGIAAGGAWFALFALKLRGLAWALRVRPSYAALAVAHLAALGLVAIPRILPSLDGRGAGALVAIWGFALVALYQPSWLASLVGLDAWGETVLRRSTRAAAVLSAGLVAAHVVRWRCDHVIDVAPIVAIAPALVLRRVRGDVAAFGIAGATLAFVFVAAPEALSATAFLVAAGLALRVPSSPEPARGIAAALTALYLAAWTFGYVGGAFPAHALAIDLAYAVAVLGVFAWTRAVSPLVPLAATLAHATAELHLVPSPRTPTQWGMTACALGFVLLGGSLAGSYVVVTRRARGASA